MPSTRIPSGRTTGALAALAFAAVLLLPNLGGYALWDPDEGRHAEVAREMLDARDWRGWLVPSFDFRPYHDKPILFYWAETLAQRLGGASEAAVRAVPALAALLVVLLVHGGGTRAWSARAGFLAAIVLATSIEFLGLGRYADLDMLLTLWLTAALLAVRRWTTEPDALRWLVVAGGATALGALTKGLVAPVLVGATTLAYLTLARRLALVRRAPVLVAAGVVVAVAGPWYVAAGIVDAAYMREFIVSHHVARFVGANGADFHAKPFWFPTVMLVAGFFPWSPLLPATWQRTLRAGRRDPASVFCAVWVAVVLVFFSLARGKLGTYILPAFPPLALLTGRALADREPDARARRLVAGGLVAIAAAAVAAPLVLVAIAARIYDGAWLPTSLASVAVLPLGIALAVVLRRGRLDLAPGAIAAGTALVALVFYGVVAPRISAVVSDAAVARTIAAAADATAPVVAYQARPASLLFYLRRPVAQTRDRRALVRALAEAPLVFVVTSPRHVADVVASGAVHPWLTSGRHVVYATQPPAPAVAADGARSRAP